MRQGTKALLVMLPAILSCSAAYAAGAHSEGPLPGFFEYLWEKKIYWINFLVYISLLGYILKKVFSKAWISRKLAYQEAISSGQRLLKDSERQLNEAKNLLSSLPAEIESLKVRMSKETEFEVQRIIRDASERAEKLKNQASQTAAAERRAAINNYKEQLVELAIELARKRVSGLLTDEVDSRLRGRVVTSVSGLVN